MQELLQASLSSGNMLPTALLVFVLLYWVMVILGVLDLDALDLDLDSDGEIDNVANLSWLNSILVFLNIGRVPLMFFLTLFVLPFWASTVLTNHYLGLESSWLSYLVLLPCFLVSLLAAKFLTLPFVALFSALEKEGTSKEAVVGQMCTILLPANGTSIGQASVKTKGAPLLLHVKTTSGGQVQKGQTALILEYQPQQQVYLIEPYQSI